MLDLTLPIPEFPAPHRTAPHRAAPRRTAIIRSSFKFLSVSLIASLTLVVWIVVSHSPVLAQTPTDFLTAARDIAEGLSPALSKKSVAIGLIQERKTAARLRLSEALEDEISVALRNKGLEVVVAAERLSRTRP